MLEPVQQAGQWMLKKAQSIPARVDQNDVLPDSGPQGLGPDQWADSFSAPRADSFEAQIPRSQTQEKGFAEKGLAPVNANVFKQLEQGLKLKLGQTQFVQRLAQKNPFQQHQSVSSRIEHQAEVSLTQKVARKLHLKKAAPPKPSPTLPRATVMRGFPEPYRNLITLPRLTISPAEVAFSVQEAKLKSWERMVYETPWDDESIFAPLK